MLVDLSVRRQNTCDSWQIWLTEPLAHLVDEIKRLGKATSSGAVRRAGEGFAPGSFAPGAPPGFPLQEMTNPVAQLTLELSRKDQRVGPSRLIACLIVHLRRCGERNHIEIRSYRYQSRRVGKGIHTTGEALPGHRVHDVKGQYFCAVVRSRGARLRVERLAGLETRPKGSVWPAWAHPCR